MPTAEHTCSHPNFEFSCFRQILDQIQKQSEPQIDSFVTTKFFSRIDLPLIVDEFSKGEPGSIRLRVAAKALKQMASTGSEQLLQHIVRDYGEQICGKASSLLRDLADLDLASDLMWTLCNLSVVKVEPNPVISREFLVLTSSLVRAEFLCTHLDMVDSAIAFAANYAIEDPAQFLLA